MCIDPPASSACSSRRRFAGVPPVSSVSRKRKVEQSPDVDEMLFRQDLGRRHERDLEVVLHRDQRGQERDDRLPGPDVPLQKAVHWFRQFHVADDLANGLLLIAGQLERARGVRTLECPR